MLQHTIQDQERPSDESFAALQALLMVTMTVNEVHEVARLVATGIPALLRCRVSGMALRQETGASWHVVLQKDEQLCPMPATEGLPTALERLFEAAMAQGRVLLTRCEQRLQGSLPWPGIEEMGLLWLVVIPLFTLRSRMGLLLVGKDSAAGFSRHEVLMLQTLAEHLAVTLGHHRLLRETCTEVAALQGRLDEEDISRQEEITTAHHYEGIIGESPLLRKMLQAVEVVAPTDTTVLLLGETGTGKELVAEAIHRLSPRRQRPLVKVNCAALPAGLIESELFGHEKGAFTGALFRKIGRFECADGGTIFLDEIGDFPPELQIKLLRILQEGEFERLGSSRMLKADVRIIAATNRDLEQAMRESRFRPDLYYRLHVFPIRLPPLRERQQDIPLLARYFASKYGAKLGKRMKTIPHKTLETLLAYPWPGNVRELENVIERAVILSPGTQLELGEWFPTPRDTASSAAPIPTLAELQREHIMAALELTGWRVSGEKGAARLLGIKPTTLEARMKKLGIRRGALLKNHVAAKIPNLLGRNNRSGRHFDGV